jgi:citronellol/citronellal dehydrogenase
MNKVALVTGSSRGIGREIALGLAKKGYNLVVASKSVTENKDLPSTIYSVANEIRNMGVDALPIQVDVRNDEQVKNMVKQIDYRYGKLDVLINNVGALWWKSIEETPIEKYDLINSINSRASFHISKSVFL